LRGIAAGLLELLGADQRHATRETDGRKKALVLSAENGPNQTAQRTYVRALWSCEWGICDMSFSIQEVKFEG
jgi:hypothetical protein